MGMIEEGSEVSMTPSFLDCNFSSEISDYEDKKDGNKNKSFEDLFNSNFDFKKEYLSNQKSQEYEFDEKLYFTPESLKKKYSESTKGENPQIKKNIFSISKLSTDESHEAQLISKKRGKKGRHRQNEQNSEKDNQKIHDRNAADNIQRKIQVHSLNYMRAYANAALKEFNYEEEFLNIDYAFKRKVNRDFLEALKTSTLSDILCNNVSSKYRTKDINANRNIYKKIEENIILKAILDEKFLVIFEFYFKNKKRISLKKYGLDKEMNLGEKAKSFKDLLDNKSNNKEYIKKLNMCIFQNYLTNSKFFDVLK